jgi:rhamnopyranosyl-N-acetylglucosaminyl-diphospho-decaprenol beta-1,3/1,4-galactofuranosyltransferase
MASDNAQDRIAAVVVTYNRKVLLAECLGSLLEQSRSLDAIYVIDNCSSDGTYEFLQERGLADSAVRPSTGSWQTTRMVSGQIPVHFVRLDENTGGAGGFREGLRRASEAGFDWIWLMDDDLITTRDALEALVRRKDGLSSRHGRLLLLNCLVLSKDRRDGNQLAFPLQEISRRGYPRIGIYHWRLSDVQGKVDGGLYRWACPFNGTMISSEAISQVGLPNKEFFIKGDEKDFLWRAAKKVAVYTVMDSRVFHPECRADVFDWKQYYGIRNMFVINKYFNFTILRDLRLIVRSLAKGLCHGPKGVRLVVRAIRDGLAGRLGKRDDVRTWLNGL